MFAKKLLSFVLAFAMLFGIVGAVQPHAHALELHEHTDDDCGCPVEETDAVEEVGESEEPEESEESETAEEPVETEEPGDAEENGTTDEAQPEDAVESEESEDEAEWEPVYDENGNFLYYSVTVHRSQVDYSEYQLTEEQLALPTEELLELVLNAFLVHGSMSLMSSNVPSVMASAYRAAYGNFNGLREFESRPDAVEALLAKLRYFVENPEATDPPNIDTMDWSYATLSFLLQQWVYREQMGSTELYAVQCAEAAIWAFNESGVRIDSESVDVDEETQLDFSNVPTVNKESVSSDASAQSTYGSFMVNKVVYDYKASIQTTSGDYDVLLYVPQRELTTAEKNQLMSYATSGRSVETLAGATSIYNCHSYAWYQASTGNPYWIPIIDGYEADAHCKVISQANVKPGMIAVYRDNLGVALHSAIVESVSGSTITCVSKWGQSGLFRHTLYEVPKDYSTDNTGNSFNITFHTYDKTHTYGSTVNNASGHHKTCTVCNKTTTTQHTFAYLANGASGHTRKCTSCSYTDSQAHTPSLQSNKCKYCNYDLTDAPVQPMRRKESDVALPAEPCTPAPKRPVLSC